MDLKSIFILIFFYLLIIYFNPVVKGDSPFGFCADSECSEPISKGKTIFRYLSPDDSRISVEPNEEVLIYVKDYGPKKDLWGITVRGNRGYISKTFIREHQLLARGLVPATFEFKSSILVTESYTVSSHLHVSSHHQSSSSFGDAAAQSVQHSQQSYINSVPDVNQQNWNSFSENLQSSHLSNNLNPSHSIYNDPVSNIEPSSWINSVPEQSSWSNNVPQQPSSWPNSDPQQPSTWSNNVPQQPSTWSNNVPQQPSTWSNNAPQQPSTWSNNVPQQPSTWSNNVPEQSSQLHNSFESFSGAGGRSDYIAPSPTHIPQVQPSPFNSPDYDYLASSSLFENSLSHEPSMDYYFSENFKFDPALSSLDPQNLNPTSAHVNSPHMAEMHSSVPLDNYEDDLSKTYSMLSDRGFGNTDMFVNQESQGHHFSQNAENFDPTQRSSSGVSSHLQHSAAQGSDILPSINPSVTGEKSVIQSDLPQGSQTFPNKQLDITPDNKATAAPKQVVEENIGEDDISELLAETDFEVDGKSAQLSADQDLMSVSQNLEITDGTSKLQPSVTLQDNLLMTKELQQPKSAEIYSDQLVSSSEDLHSDQVQKSVEPSLIQQEKSVLISSSMSDSVQTETKNIGDTPDSHLSTESVPVSDIKKPLGSSDKMNFTKSDLEKENLISDIISPLVGENSEESVEENEILEESFLEKDILSDFFEENNNDAFITENSVYSKENTSPKINEIFIENDEQSGIESFLNTIDTSGINEDLTTYQPRNLKGEFGTNEEQPSDSDGTSDENNTNLESDSYNSSGSWFDGIKSLVDSIMSWIPDPFYTALMDLQNKGISPRVPVFTALCGFMCILLIGFLVFIKEWSKESELSAQLTSIEKKAYNLSATNIILEEKLESVQNELATLKEALTKEKSLSENVKVQFEDQSEELENTKAELENCLDALEALKNRENEYVRLINNHAKEKEQYSEHKESLDKILKDAEDTIANLSDQLLERENKLNDLEKEKEQFLVLKADYEEKLALFDSNCNTLLQEAEVWNLRVNELTEKLNEERGLKEEMVVSLKEREAEVESLKELVETFKVFDEIEDPEEQAKTKEEKLQFFLNNSMIANQLKKEEEKNKVLDEQLGKEKNRLLDMEVELLDAKSDIDKLKLSYNQALQDKAEAQTKLEVLTNYFKDKEIQLQRQLGAQEAVRQKTEEDASSAERRIILIEQENISYKSQVASMKQEMEETERTLKSQIAAQEKKAHENWIAARAAERKLEDMKQEVTQLRQRLTLLEREQENFVPRDEIIRPVPKRIPGVNEDASSQDLNISERGMFPPPYHDRLPPPPMMLPPDRPLPPLPPPIPPMFLPPMERHFRNPPWHMPPDPGSNYRTTPPEFIPGRESTPPRGRPITDGDSGPHVSSPLTTDTRDSRNSTPPHLLPDFHDVPPQPGRPFFPPPPMGRPRFPVYQPYRREAGLEPKRLDNPNETNSRGSQQPPPPENWQQSRV